jgi:hypothetical protein
MFSYLVNYSLTTGNKENKYEKIVVTSKNRPRQKCFISRNHDVLHGVTTVLKATRFTVSQLIVRNCSYSSRWRLRQVNGKLVKIFISFSWSFMLKQVIVIFLSPISGSNLATCFCIYWTDKKVKTLYEWLTNERIVTGTRFFTIAVSLNMQIYAKGIYWFQLSNYDIWQADDQTKLNENGKKRVFS